MTTENSTSNLLKLNLWIKQLSNEKKYDAILRLIEKQDIEKLKPYITAIELLKKFDKMKDNLTDVIISQLRVSLKSDEDLL